MSAERISSGARRFVAVGAVLLPAAALALLLDEPRTAVDLVLFGFVLHTVFGKAYSLVPTYFDRTLAFPRAPTVQLPLTTLGTIGLAVAPFSAPTAEQTGAVFWTLGVVVFLGTMAWTIRDNLSGRETATGEASAGRKPIDRVANAFVPIALAYLALGSYAVLAAVTPLPALIDGYHARASHLLAAGTGALLLFAIGFRLLPRFLVAAPPRFLVPVVLVPGALGPLLLAVGLPSGPLVHAGAVLEALAVAAFAATYVLLFVRSPRTRVGFYGVLAGVCFGVVGVALGLTMAFHSLDAAVLDIHRTVNLFGFLGLSIVGVSYQFYPPAVASFPGGSDRTATVAMTLIGSGLLVYAVGLTLGVDAVADSGGLLLLLGTVGHALLLLGLFVERYS